MALAVVVLLLALAVGGAGLWLSGRLRASLPELSGEVAVAGLAAPVTVERDALGVPTIRGVSRRDVALATGFVHAQDRFFQMDLLRRSAAGELAELIGVPALAADRAVRNFRLRERARRMVAAGSPEVRGLLEAYAEGVNAGLGGLGAPPPEYLLLGADPRPWQPEDSALVVFAMFVTLQGQGPRGERAMGLMHDLLPAPLFDFLTPAGDSWDAPIEGEALEPPPVPRPEVVDLRRSGPAPPPAAASLQPGTAAEAAPEMPGPEVAEPAGSNNWALAGTHTADGAALLANDMHLPLTAPNLWYRASFVWPEADGASRKVTGITLPGVPIMVVGSNGRVAWGYTNTEADTSDVVLLDAVGSDPEAYLTPDGPLEPETAQEVIRVKGGGDDVLTVRDTIWGPMLKEDKQGRRRALAWVAIEPGGAGFGSLGLETATSVDEAVEIAVRSNLPAQNLVVAGADGRIAWTIAGRLPHRVGFDGRVPTSWSDGSRRWEGLLPPEEVPRVIDPPSGRLWTANNRVVGGEAAAKIGDGGLVPGARAGLIRDRLAATENATPADMLAIQLDDSARFHERWRDLWLATLTPEAVAADPRPQRFRDLLASWSGHAAADSVAYRLVHDARSALAAEVFAALTAPCKEVDPDFNYTTAFYRYEGPLWRLVSERPAHLLKPGYRSWDEQLLAAVDRTVDSLESTGSPLATQTWGRYNTVRVRHPLSAGVPLLGRWLDLPAVELPGDLYMPRVQAPGFGASERLVVAPGHEEAGIFHMPGGQSGHPLSPHYGDGQDAWVAGEATPFLPGPTVSTLTLEPVE